MDWRLFLNLSYLHVINKTKHKILLLRIEAKSSFSYAFLSIAVWKAPDGKHLFQSGVSTFRTDRFVCACSFLPLLSVFCWWWLSPLTRERQTKRLTVRIWWLCSGVDLADSSGRGRFVFYSRTRSPSPKNEVGANSWSTHPLEFSHDRRGFGWINPSSASTFHNLLPDKAEICFRLGIKLLQIGEFIFYYHCCNQCVDAHFSWRSLLPDRPAHQNNLTNNLSGVSFRTGVKGHHNQHQCRWMQFVRWKYLAAVTNVLLHQPVKSPRRVVVGSWHGRRVDFNRITSPRVPAHLKCTD